MRKFVGIALAASAALGILAFIFEGEQPTAFTESLFILTGLGLYVFGIWASVLLIRDN